MAVVFFPGKGKPDPFIKLQIARLDLYRRRAGAVLISATIRNSRSRCSWTMAVYRDWGFVLWLN